MTALMQRVGPVLKVTGQVAQGIALASVFVMNALMGYIMFAPDDLPKPFYLLIKINHKQIALPLIEDHVLYMLVIRFIPNVSIRFYKIIDVINAHKFTYYIRFL